MQHVRINEDHEVLVGTEFLPGNVSILKKMVMFIRMCDVAVKCSIEPLGPFSR